MQELVVRGGASVPYCLLIGCMVATSASGCVANTSGHSEVEPDTLNALPDKFADSASIEDSRLEPAWEEGCEVRHIFRVNGAAKSEAARASEIAPNTEEIRQFYFRSPWEGPMWLLKSRSIGINPNVVHHWALFQVNNARLRDGEMLSGTSFVDVFRVQDAQAIVNGGPGGSELELPPDVGLRMPNAAGIGYLLEVHYYSATSMNVERDTTGVELCLTSKATSNIAAIHALGRSWFELPAHVKTDVVSTCKPTNQTEPVHILAIAPHMHLTGVRATVNVNRFEGERETIFDQPYNFREQRTYRVPQMAPADEAGVSVRPGDTISTTCAFDNTTDSAINAGSFAEDEMCLFFAWVWPAGILKNEYQLGADFMISEDADCIEP